MLIKKAYYIVLINAVVGSVSNLCLFGKAVITYCRYNSKAVKV